MITSLCIVMFLIGTITGMFLHYLLLKAKIDKKQKRTNPHWCGDKNNCLKHICKNMPDECEYDMRDLL